ncbi:hypothetical protein, partial [Streptomyces rubrogriseus]
MHRRRSLYRDALGGRTPRLTLGLVLVLVLVLSLVLGLARHRFVGRAGGPGPSAASRGRLGR